MKKFTFSYNSNIAVKSPVGTKQSYVLANNKTEARKKIMEFLNGKGELCHEYF